MREELLQRPWARLGKGGHGQAGLAARVASGFAPGTDNDGGHVLVQARMGLEAVGDLRTGLPRMELAQLCPIWCPVG